MRVGSTELAKILGISRQRVNELGRRQKITREPDGLWDLDKVRAQLGQTLDAQQASRVRSPRGRTSGEFDSEAMQMPSDGGTNAHDLFNRARAAKEIAIAKEKQLALRKIEGELLEAADVDRTWTAALTSFKNRLLLIPDRLAARLAATSSTIECREILYAEMLALLAGLSETKTDEVA